MRILLTTVATLALLLPAATPLAAQGERDTSFHWEGSIPAGKWLVVRDLNGSVRVEASSSGKVEVDAVKQWRRGNPEDVKITVEHYGSDKASVVVCAIWNENTRCDEDGYSSHNDGSWRNRNNDVSVQFTVKLPPGVKIETSTVNGSLRIAGATSEVEASTVNGGVDAVSSGGPVRATTVNGDVDVQMSALGAGDLEYSTVNGSVHIALPAQLDAELDMSTVNGSLRSDFPLSVTGRISPRRIHATIGNGGRRIRVTTVNGSVELRKA